jgi:hypothetical protein
LQERTKDRPGHLDSRLAGRPESGDRRRFAVQTSALALRLDALLEKFGFACQRLRTPFFAATLANLPVNQQRLNSVLELVNSSNDEDWSNVVNAMRPFSTTTWNTTALIAGCKDAISIYCYAAQRYQSF